LQYTRFTSLQGSLDDYHLYVLLAPHLGNRGDGNTAWIGDYKGMPMLFAERDGNALALACSAPWLKRSAGFVGASDGWQDLRRHRQMTWIYAQAENGNVALTGEVDLLAFGGTFVLALGFGRNPAEAGHRVLASLRDGFERTQAEYVRQWQAWQQTLPFLNEMEAGKQDLSRVSTAVIRTHEAKRFPGGIIASLSVPWGASKGDDDLGGYHLVWPRFAGCGGG
jgi:glucoamylase